MQERQFWGLGVCVCVGFCECARVVSSPVTTSVKWQCQVAVSSGSVKGAGRLLSEASRGSGSTCQCLGHAALHIRGVMVHSHLQYGMSPAHTADRVQAPGKTGWCWSLKGGACSSVRACVVSCVCRCVHLHGCGCVWCLVHVCPFMFVHGQRRFCAWAVSG